MVPAQPPLEGQPSLLTLSLPLPPNPLGSFCEVEGEGLLGATPTSGGLFIVMVECAQHLPFGALKIGNARFEASVNSVQKMSIIKRL